MSRPLRIDLQAITEKDEFLAVALEHFRELNPAFSPDADWEKEYFRNITANPNYSLRWIIADGTRAGFVLFGIEAHRFLPRQTGAVYELYVVPELRRRGIASACAKVVLDELWKSSPSKVQLEVVEGNTAAARMWKGLGFQKISERFTLARSKRTPQ
jgi:ribosomal protein S18 acetylase RimI-like enzyme